jgi:hypothetical protein
MLVASSACFLSFSSPVLASIDSVYGHQLCEHDNNNDYQSCIYIGAKCISVYVLSSQGPMRNKCGLITRDSADEQEWLPRQNPPNRLFQHSSTSQLPRKTSLSFLPSFYMVHMWVERIHLLELYASTFKSILFLSVVLLFLPLHM